MTHFFLIELSPLYLIPNPWWVRCSLIFLLFYSLQSLALCRYVLPRPNMVLIIALLRLFMSLSVPCPKSSSIALTLCLIPSLVHDPQSICLSFLSKRDAHCFNPAFFPGLPQPWTNLMIDLAFPDLNRPNRWAANQLPHIHLSVLPSLFSTQLPFLLTLNNPNAITSNYPARPRLPPQRVCSDCLSHPACFASLFCHSMLHSHTVTELQLSLYPSSTFPLLHPHIPGLLLQLSNVIPRGLCSLVLQWPLSDLIKAFFLFPLVPYVYYSLLVVGVPYHIAVHRTPIYVLCLEKCATLLPPNRYRCLPFTFCPWPVCDPLINTTRAELFLFWSASYFPRLVSIFGRDSIHVVFFQAELIMMLYLDILSTTPQSCRVWFQH